MQKMLEEKRLRALGILKEMTPRHVDIGVNYDPPLSIISPLSASEAAQPIMNRFHRVTRAASMQCESPFESIHD